MTKTTFDDNKNKNKFVTLISDSKKEIDKLADKTKDGKELEFIFFSGRDEFMNKEKYMYFGKYMSTSDTEGDYKLKASSQMLDINLSLNDNETLRVTVMNDGASDNITNVYNNLILRGNNYSALRMALYLARKSGDKKKYNVMIKTRSEDNTYDINEFNIRCKLSDEKDIFDDIINKSSGLHPTVKKLMSNDKNAIPIKERKEIDRKIIYRYKERLTMIYDQTKDYLVQLDLTFVRSGRRLKRINTEVPNYELELEIQAKKMSSELKTQMYDRLESIVELIQQSDFIVSTGMRKNVVGYYKRLMYGDANARATSLYGRQPVSLEVQHVISKLSNNFAVTDKADGDRTQLIIYDAQVYLIYNDLSVRDTGIVLKSSSASKYNGTIADGEFIYSEKYDRHIFMAFDCMFIGEKDIRGEDEIMSRLKNLDKMVADCFAGKDEKGFTFDDKLPEMKSFDLDKVANFHASEIKRFYKNLIHDVSQESVYPLIRRKFFIPVNGAAKWEIFKYSLTFWKSYTEDSTIEFPYHLDGLIYHPLLQKYTTDKSKSKFEEYKWKPAKQNSIDFYIEFQKDPLTRKDLIVYDNTNQIKNRPYKICKLHVGNNVGNREKPEPFTLNEGYSEAYLFLEDGDKEARDQDGEILLDSTVAEFYYNNSPDLDPRQRWVPMRTRHDKTTFVERYRRKYGNYHTVASKVWRSIMNPVKMSDFADLAKGGSKYGDKLQSMGSTIGSEAIVAEAKEKAYYITTQLARSMRWFHNWIKSIILYTHGHHMYRFNIPQSVIEFGCGRGGDNLKHYYNEISHYVGIDLDLDNLINPVNGAISRYNNYKKNKARAPPMHFIQSDLRSLLNVDDQMKALGGMTSDNERLLRKFFPKGGKQSVFDMASCQFAVHYFLETKESWKNFKQNLKTVLRAGGTFIVTTFDGGAVRKLLDGKERYTEYFNDKVGEKRILFDLVKRFDDGVPQGTGNKIDFHGAWMFADGEYYSEYLVDKEFFTNELSEECDLELVDYDLFENQYNIHRDYFKNYAKYQADENTRGMLLRAGTYYDDTGINESLRKFTNLSAYYIFRRRGTTKPQHDERFNRSGSRPNSGRRQRGGSSEVNGQKYDFTDNKKFGIMEMHDHNSKYSFLNGIYGILSSNKLIPEIGSNAMCNDLGIKYSTDIDLMSNSKRIKKVCTNIVIDHEFDNPKAPGKTVTKTVLDGLNVITVSRDCNNHYDIEYIRKTSKKKSKKDDYVILIKDGPRFLPLCRKEENGKTSIFKGSDDLIKYLTKNGEDITP